MGAMLVVRGLNCYYGKSHIIAGLDLTLNQGEVLALLGRNGAGKTTTILGILGLLRTSNGSVTVDGVEIGGRPAYRRAKAGIAYVPSGARCFPNLTVQENLEIAARPAGKDGWTKDRVYEVFPKLHMLRGNMAGGLSGGERQMLATGRALMSNPKAILFDEPTEGLAPVIVQRIGELLVDLKQTRIAILLAEQNHNLALRVADRAAFMEKGKIVGEMGGAEARSSELIHQVLGV